MRTRIVSLLLGLALGAPPLAGVARAEAPEHEPTVEQIRPEDAPRLARMTRLSGTVVVEALVDETGHVRATSVARSQPALDDEAQARVEALRFPPLMVDGKAVASVHTLAVTFVAPKASGPVEGYATARCGETAFGLDLDARPDSAGVFTARWTASGLKSQELLVIVQFPDGASVDTTHSWAPQRFQDRKDAAAWPAWHREGRDVRKGTEGSFSFRLPDSPWWRLGRIAVVAMFRDVFDGRTVLRQRAFRVERDAMGALLVGDPGATACAAGPWYEGR